MSTASLFLRQPFWRLAAAGRRLDRLVNGTDLVVGNLTPAQSRSLAAALSAAAIVSEAEPASVRIRHAQNRMFRPDHFTAVIDEWRRGDEQRQPVVRIESR